MKPVVYSCPFVPAEWIAAHGLPPSRILPRADVPPSPAVGPMPGLCPYARAFMNAVTGGRPAAAVIVTTVCDQMRRAADLLAFAGLKTPLPHREGAAGGSFGRAGVQARAQSLPGSFPAISRKDGEPELKPDGGQAVSPPCVAAPPVFVLNVPATRRPETERLYRREVQRLGRFLIEIGGQAASPEALASVMRAHDAARAAIRAGRERLHPRQFSERIAAFHRDGGRLPASSGESVTPDGIPLVLVGGPLRDGDFRLFDVIERAGGTVVLDATETGERTLPASFDDHALRKDPLGELVRAYFGSILDVSCRPNTGLFTWLAEQVSNRGARGIICRRYVWCDSWHAEVHRLREHLGLPVLDLGTPRGSGGPLLREHRDLPVLDLDIDDDGVGANERAAGRIEAFVEMLKA